MNSIPCKNLNRAAIGLAVAGLSLFSLTTEAQAPSATGNPFDKTVRLAPHLEPAIPHPSQAQTTQDKLTAMKKRAGRAPNILLIVVDDLGWSDIGLTTAQ